MADFLFALVFIPVDMLVGLLFLICGICYSIVIPALNYFGLISTSRFAFAFFGQTILTAMAFYMGEKSYAHIPLLLGACTPFCMISPKEVRLWACTLMIPLVYFPMLYYFDFDIGVHLPEDLIASNYTIILAVMWGFTFIAITLVTLLFTTQATNHETNLNNTIGQLNDEVKARKEAETALKGAKHRLDMLMGILTHDLGSYGTIMSFYTQKLQNQNLDPLDSRSTIDKLATKTSGLLELINNARHLQAVAAGLEVLDKSPVKIQDLLDDVVEAIGLKIQQKGLELKINLSSQVAQSEVNVNKTTIVNHVFCNILSNAAKFSHTGSSIDVDVKDTGGFIELAITDHGIGMPKNILDTLFVLEVRTSRQGTNKESGTGMGMPLCKYYCEQCDGTLVVTSKDQKDFPEDHGTTVTVTFPKVAA